MDRRQFTKNMLMSSAGLPFVPCFEPSKQEGRKAEEELMVFKPLFNGVDLTGFVNVNTSKNTWTVENGILVCTGNPTGVIRTEKQFENFILEIEWKHLEAGGNSGVFVWADGTPHEDNPFPRGVEIQMLDPEITETRGLDKEYAHGHLFPVMGLDAIPDHPSNIVPGRSAALENRVKGKGQWNKYVIVCVDGVIKLSVNGKFVNGIRVPDRKKGYICPESEGAEIHFRSMNIMELPGGVLSRGESAPILE